MFTSDFIINVNDTLRGTDDDPPAAGTDEFDYWLRVANRVRSDVYSDTSKAWASTYAVLNLGAVSASATPIYNLGATFLSPANDAYVLDASSRRTDFKIIKPQEKDPRYQQVYIASINPQKLYFTQEILAAHQIVGGTLYLPGYFMPADLTGDDAEAEVVIVDYDNWLIVATAAQLAFNDLTYEDKFTDLNNRANSLYKQMVSLNRRGTYDNPRQTPYNVPRIPGTSNSYR